MSKMFNKLATSGATTVTDKLGLDSEVRELKFGSSFNPGNRGQSSFHSIKYDFKPASVDKSKSATLEVGPNGQVSISMPHYDTTGSTMFKGSTRPYTKECVLIIDKDTGEIVLEKLSHNVQVKKTRQEGSGKNSSKETGNLPQVEAGPASGRSSFTNNSQRHDQLLSEDRESNSRSIPNKRPISASVLNPPTSNHGHGRRPNSPLPPNVAGAGASSRHSPLPSNNTTLLTGHSPSRRSPYETQKSNSSAAAFDVLVSKQVTAPALLSLTSLEDLITATPPPALPPSSQSNSSKKDIHHQKLNAAIIASAPNESGQGGVTKHKHAHGSTSDKKSTGDSMMMSDSSDDSSSSSSSEDDDSSSSDMEDVALPPSIAGQAAAAAAAAAAAPIPMDISSRGNSRTSPAPPPARLPPPANNVPGSMPNFFSLADNMPSHVLSEDLQLSESGSSSDSD